MKCDNCSSEFTPHDRATIGSNAGDYVEVRTACPSCEHVYYTFTSGPWTEEDQGNTPQSPTPTGLPPKAQGCAPRATLGIHTQTPINPERVASQCFRCDGPGGVCNICGESERACGCGDETAIVECSDCKGTGL